MDQARRLAPVATRGAVPGDGWQDGRRTGGDVHLSETAEQHAGATGPGQAGPGQETGAARRAGPWDQVRAAGLVFARQREATILVVTLLLLLYFGLTSSTFFSYSNITNLLSGFAAPIIIIAIGEVMLLICGEIDLSVGFVFTLSPFIMYFLITYYSVPVILAILLSLFLGVVVGWVNGFITVTLGVPSFITTLGTGFVLWGIMLTTSHAEPVTIPNQAQSIGKFFGSQNGGYAWASIIWAVLLVLIFHIVLTRTRWGLHTVAVGGNLLGARESGISVARIKYGNFMICGLMGAIVGIQTAFYDQTIDPSAGQYQPMFYAVAAAVIGGTAMLGGSGTVLGALLGGMVLAILQDGFQVAGISANPLNIIFGGAILIAMLAHVQAERLRAAGRV
jgi:simple sugar transport system permease protein